MKLLVYVVTTVGDNLCMIDLAYDDDDRGDSDDDEEGVKEVGWEGKTRTSHLRFGGTICS